MTTGNYFRDFLTRTDERELHKLDHYLDIYHRLLAPLKGRTVRFLEIGVYRGGSIAMWQGYFSPESTLVFADIDPDCRRFAAPGVNIAIGDQSDPAFLSRLGQTWGPFDLIIDDGGHMMHQQIASLTHLWPHLAFGGTYVVEDCHTSYWPGFGGGYRREGSFIEHAKGLIDLMNSWHTDQDEIFPRHLLSDELATVQFHDSMVILEKQRRVPPEWITSRNGEVRRTRRPLHIRGRVSVFNKPGAGRS